MYIIQHVSEKRRWSFVLRDLHCVKYDISVIGSVVQMNLRLPSKSFNVPRQGFGLQATAKLKCKGYE